MSIAPALELSLLFSYGLHGSYTPTSVRIYALIFSIVFVCLKLTGNEIYLVHKTKKNISHLFGKVNLVVFYNQRSCA